MGNQRLAQLIKELISARADLEILKKNLDENEVAINESTPPFFSGDSTEENLRIELENRRRKLELSRHTIEQREKMVNLNLVSYLKDLSITHGEVEIDDVKYDFQKSTIDGVEIVKVKIEPYE